MNQTSSIIKIATVIVVVAGIGFFGYNYLNGSPTTTDSLSVIPNDTSSMGAEVLSALNQLNRLNLDAGIFSDATFKSLKDFSRPLPVEPVGRINPFSPIGVETASSNSQAAATSSKTSVQQKKSTVTSQ